MQSMIDETERMISTVGDAITKINELNAAIKSLPDGKDIEINVTGNAVEVIDAIKEDIATLDGKTVEINVVYHTFGSEPDAVTEDVTQIIKQVVVPAEGAGSDTPINTQEIDQATDAVEKFSDESVLAAVDARALDEGINRLTASYQEMSVASDDARESLVRLAQAIVEGNVSNKPGAPLNPIEQGGGPAEDISNSADAVNEMRTALGALNTDTAASVVDMKALEDAIGNTDGDMRLLAAGINVAANANNVMRGGVNDLHDSFAVLYPDVQRTEGSIAGLVIPAGAVVAFFQQWGTVIHWVISGSAELLAVGVPALIALGSAALVAAQAATNLYSRFQAMFTVEEALGPVTGETVGTMQGLGNTFQEAQNKMQPQLYEIYGAAVDGLKSHLGSLAQMGSQVIGVFDTFAAKLDVELQGALGTQLTGLISKAVPDLVEFGQVFGNLGHAILNFASDMPGLAEVLLKVLDAFSDLLKIISEIPAPIITAAMAMEEFLRWGSLVNSMIAFLLGSFGKLIGSEGITGVALAMKGMKMEMDEATGEMVAVDDEANAGVVSFGGFARTIMTFVSENPLAAAAILVTAAITVFVVWTMRAQSATDQWISSMQKAITSAPDYSQMNLTLQALSATTKEQATAQGVLNTKTSEWAALASGAQENVTALKQANQTFNEEITTESTNVAFLAKELGVSAPEAIGIMQGAGVKLTDTLQGNSEAAEVNRQKIDNLLTAYQILGQSGNQLAADINAVSIASSSQLANVNKLNQAWQTFIGLGVSAQSDFIAFQQGLATISTDAGAAGASFNGLNASSLTLRNDFESNITTMAKSLSDLNTGLSFGAISWNQYQTAVATEAKEMLDAGNLSAAQISQLGLVASAAGYTGNSYSSLKSWVDKYAGSSQNLNGIINATTIGLSNQNSMMEQLQGTLQSDVIDSTDQAILAQGGYTEQLSKTIAAAKDAGTGSADYKSNLKDLDGILHSAGASQQTINSINEDLAKTYKDVGKNAGDSIDNVKNLGSTLGAQGIAADGLRDQIKDVFIAIGHYMGASLLGILKATGDSFKDFWDGMVSVAKIGADLLTGNWSGAWNALKSAAADIGGSILSTIKGVFDQIAPILEIPWNAIPASWRKAAENAVSAIMGVLTPAWNTIVSAAKTAFNSVTTAMVTAWNNLVGFAKTVWGGVEGAAVTAWQATIGFIQSLGDKFDAWWAQHGNELKQLWNEIWSFMVTATSMATAAIKGTVSIFWGVIVDLAKTAWNILGPIVTTGWALIRTLFTIGSALVVTIAQTMWNAVVTTAREAWNIIEPLIKAGWNDIVTTFDIVGAAVRAIWTELWDVATTILKTAWDAIVAILKVGWDLIVGMFDVFLDLLTGHWSQAWNDIKTTAEQIWNAVAGFFDSAFHNYEDLFEETWNNVKNFFETTWNDIYGNIRSVWGDIMGFFRGVWSDIVTGFRTTVSGISSVWDTLDNIFNKPVSFLINTVYMGGIRRLWDAVAGAVGIPDLPSLAEGGKLPGYGGGDIIPALLEPGETVVSKEHSKLLVDTFKSIGVPGYASGGSAGAGPPTAGGRGGSLGFSPTTGTPVGGIPGGGVLADIGKDIANVTSIVAALATGNTTALVNDMLKVVGTGGALAEYAKMIVAIPTTLIKDAVKTLAGDAAKQAALESGPAGGATGSEMANGAELYQYLLKNVFDGHKIAAAGAIASIWGECVTLDHKILTKRGYLNHDEVVVGDETIGYNPETDKSEWTRINRVVHYEQKPVITLTSGKFSATFTPNHRWLTEEGFKKYSDCTDNDRIVLSKEADTGEGLPITTAEAVIIGGLARDHNIKGVDLSPETCKDIIGRAGDPKLDAMYQVLHMSVEQRQAWLKSVLATDLPVEDREVIHHRLRRDNVVANAIELALYFGGYHRDNKVSATEKKITGFEDVWCVSTDLGSWTAQHDAFSFLTGNSEWNPLTSGTGGRGLIGWTPAGTISNAAFEGGMRTQEPAIIAFINSSGDEGVIREMESATSVSQAANEWGVGVERYGIDDVHAEGIALATSIMNSSGSPAPAQGLATAIAHASRSTQDAGGWVYPGMNLIQNNTGRIERTLGPNESSGPSVVHTVVQINGKDILDAISPAMYQKGSRNNGNANANRYFAPGNGR
jgi:phage-related protein